MSMSGLEIGLKSWGFFFKCHLRICAISFNPLTGYKTYSTGHSKFRKCIFFHPKNNGTIINCSQRAFQRMVMSVGFDNLKFWGAISVSCPWCLKSPSEWVKGNRNQNHFEIVSDFRAFIRSRRLVKFHLLFHLSSPATFFLNLLFFLSPLSVDCTYPINKMIKLTKKPFELLDHRRSQDL
jgi:hypothetical protein